MQTRLPQPQNQATYRPQFLEADSPRSTTLQPLGNGNHSPFFPGLEDRLQAGKEGQTNQEENPMSKYSEEEWEFLADNPGELAREFPEVLKPTITCPQCGESWDAASPGYQEAAEALEKTGRCAACTFPEPFQSIFESIDRVHVTIARLREDAPCDCDYSYEYLSGVIAGLTSARRLVEDELPDSEPKKPEKWWEQPALQG